MYVDKIYTCYGHVSSLIPRGANLSQKGCIDSSSDSFIHKRLTTSADKLSTRTLVLRCPTQLDRRVTSCACGHIEKWNYTVCGGHYTFVQKMTVTVTTNQQNTWGMGEGICYPHIQRVTEVIQNLAKIVS